MQAHLVSMLSCWFPLSMTNWRRPTRQTCPLLHYPAATSHLAPPHVKRLALSHVTHLAPPHVTHLDPLAPRLAHPAPSRLNQPSVGQLSICAGRRPQERRFISMPASMSGILSRICCFTQSTHVRPNAAKAEQSNSLQFGYIYSDLCWFDSIHASSYTDKSNCFNHTKFVRESNSYLFCTQVAFDFL